MSTIKVTNLKHESSSSDNITLDSSGRVGIGTSSPGRNFQVADSSNAFLSAKCGSVEGFINVTSSAVNLESSSGIPVTFSPGGTLRGQFDTSGNLKFNSGFGSVATAYAVRAWVSFSLSTGSPVIGAHGNIDSIDDNNVGRFTVNFVNAFPDTNYVVMGLTQTGTSGVDDGSGEIRIGTRNGSNNVMGVTNTNESSFADNPRICIAWLR